jgi:hypothetical protein
MEPIADELKQFIYASFETLDQLRILLLLQANPDRDWRPAAISASLHVQADVAQQSLDRLRQKGFLDLPTGSERQYRYQPASVELAQQVSAVAELDRTRPVTLIRLIYQKA